MISYLVLRNCIAVSACAKLKFLIVFMLFGLPLHFYQIITGDLNVPQYKKYRGS